MSCIGKILLLSFDGDEENLIESVISILDAGREKFTFQEIKLKPELQHKGIVIDLERREVIRNDEKVELTYTEFEILQLLAQNTGRVFSKEQIYEAVWKEAGGNCEGAVTNIISQLRHKLNPDNPKEGYIRTVVNSGYRFEA